MNGWTDGHESACDSTFFLRTALKITNETNKTKIMCDVRHFPWYIDFIFPPTVRIGEKNHFNISCIHNKFPHFSNFHSSSFKLYLISTITCKSSCIWTSNWVGREIIYSEGISLDLNKKTHFKRNL